MTYFKESERLIYQTIKFTVHMVKWGREGQCVSMSPKCKMIVRFAGGVEIEVSARSDHKARQIALDIGELFS